MFAYLSFYEGEKGIGALFSRDKIDSERVTLPNGEVFFSVKVKKRKGKIPWKKLCECLGILREGVLLDEKISIPDGIGISRFIPEEYHLLIFFSSVVKNIKAQPKIYSSLCVYDEKGLFMPYTKELVTYFSQIKIITPLVKEYERVSYEIFSEYGMAMLVTNKGNLDGEIAVSPKGSVAPVTFSGTLYSLDRPYLLSGRVLCPKNLSVPEICKVLCPEDIDPLAFSAALYERCNLNEALQGEYEKFS